MNTQKILIKISAIGIFSLSLFIEISINSYAEEKTSETIAIHNSHKADESMLFTFIRNSNKLEVYATATGANLAEGDNLILASLPFRDLYHKLQNKLLNLATTEAKEAASKDILTEEMQKVMSALIVESAGFDNTILAFREKFKEYPNTSDLISLTAASIHDAKEIFELSTILNEGNTKEKEISKELLEMIFDDAMNSYKSFVSKNEDALKIISRLADDGFKLKDAIITCETFMGDQLCETEEKSKEIKNFSEIMPYVMELQKEQSIKNSLLAKEL